MKKILLPCFALISLVACNSGDDKSLVKDTSIDSTSSSTVKLPVDVAYKGTASIGKTENIATVMNWNTSLINGKVDDIGKYLADSLTATMADGSVFNMSRDSVVVFLKGWRSSMESATQDYFSAIAIDNKEAGDEWVIQWTTENMTFKDGKKEGAKICEAYLLKGGKIRQISQYAQQLPKTK
jgi:hypothetical protein